MPGQVHLQAPGDFSLWSICCFRVLQSEHVSLPLRPRLFQFPKSLQTSCGPGFRRRDRCTSSCPLGNNHEKSILDTLRLFRQKQRGAVQLHRSLCPDVAFHRPHKHGASRRGHMHDRIFRLQGSLRHALLFCMFRMCGIAFSAKWYFVPNSDATGLH